jgi:hypothetical protein
MPPRIEDLVDTACGAAIEAEAAAVRALRMKAAAVAEAEHLRVTGGLVDRFPSSQGLGNLRLDGADRPATPTITGSSEYASWLADHAPDTVTATLTVPAPLLEQAMEALGFAGIPGTPAVTPGPAAGEFLRDRCIVQADPDLPGGWLVLHVDGQRHTHPVPGVTASRPSPRWVLTPTSQLKKDAAQRAGDAADAELALLRTDLAADPDPTPAAARPALTVVPEPAAAPPERSWTGEDLDLLDMAGLRHLCKEAGLRATGNKRDLRSRLTDHRAARTAAAG